MQVKFMNLTVDNMMKLSQQSRLACSRLISSGTRLSRVSSNFAHCLDRQRCLLGAEPDGLAEERTDRRCRILSHRI
jgi:hypothetical protein